MRKTGDATNASPVWKLFVVKFFGYIYKKVNSLSSVAVAPGNDPVSLAGLVIDWYAGYFGSMLQGDGVGHN